MHLFVSFDLCFSLQEIINSANIEYADEKQLKKMKEELADVRFIMGHNRDKVFQIYDHTR